MADASPLLPGVPAEIATRAEIKREKVKLAARKRSREGYEHISGFLHRDEIDYLMQVWQFETKAQLVRVALRFLAQQTQAGLTEINLPGSMR